MGSGFAKDARGEGGHVWLPLSVSGDRGGATVVNELGQGIKAIRAVAAGVRARSARALVAPDELR